MATNRNSEHLRYRYGICLNDNCQKCKNKEVQQVSARKEFVCEECGKPLRECPPPKSGPNKIVIAAIAAVVVIAVGIGLFLGFSGSEVPEPSPADSINVQKRDSLPQPQSSDTVTVVKTDTVIKTDTVVVKERVPAQAKVVTVPTTQAAAPKTNTSVSQTGPKVSFGYYSGPSNGLGGTISVTNTYSLDLRKGDGTCLDLQPGDQIQQTKFVDGDLKQGVWIHQGVRQFFTR